MTEPWMEADRIESEWDRKCASAPTCSCCGGSVYPYETFLEFGDIVLCEHCIERNTMLTDNLEI